jgi:hypothetical protein
MVQFGSCRKLHIISTLLESEDNRRQCVVKLKYEDSSNLKDASIIMLKLHPDVLVRYTEKLKLIDNVDPLFLLYWYSEKQSYHLKLTTFHRLINWT